MTRKPDTARAVVMATVLVVTGSWFLRGAPAPAAPREMPPFDQRPAGARPVVLPESALPRVRWNNRSPLVAPTRSPRDPFRFDAPGMTRSTRVSSPAPPRSSVGLGSPVNEPERELVLLGVAEDSGEDGTRRTAVVGGAEDRDDDLWLVREGDMLTEQYRIEHVGPEFAVLVDVRTSRKRHLVMR